MIKWIADKLGGLVIAYILLISGGVEQGNLEQNASLQPGYWKNGYVAPTKDETRVRARFEAVISYYTADPAQTDDTPCITADGTNICKSKENIVAANGLDFGTKVRVDGVVYRVADRMNRRYPQGYMDILVESKEEAIKLGRQTKIVEILE